MASVLPRLFMMWLQKRDTKDFTIFSRDEALVKPAALV